MCGCAGNDDFSRIREMTAGNVCAQQRARAEANGSPEGRPVVPPALRVTAVLDGLSVDKFGDVEGQFVTSVAGAAGVDVARVLVLSVMETGSRRHTF